MGSAANGDAAPISVLDLLAAFYQLAEVAESTRSICVREDDVLSPCMSHTMCNRTALASVLFQGNDTDTAMRYMRRGECHLGAVLRPRTSDWHWVLAQLVFLRKFQRFVDSPVCAAVADYQDLPTLFLAAAFRTLMRRAILALQAVSYTHLRAPRDGLLSRMPSSA